MIIAAAKVWSFYAGRYYEDGDCLGIRFVPYPVPPSLMPPWWFTRVQAGTTNCS